MWNDERTPNLVSEFNSVTFDPLFGQNVSKWKNQIFCQFFFAKEGEMLSVLKSKTRFRILSSLHNFLIPICKILQILILLVFHSNFKISITLGDQYEHFWKKTNYATLIREEKITRIGGHTWRNFKKLKCLTQLCECQGFSSKVKGSQAFYSRFCEIGNLSTL